MSCFKINLFIFAAIENFVKKLKIFQKVFNMMI